MDSRGAPTVVPPAIYMNTLPEHAWAALYSIGDMHIHKLEREWDPLGDNGLIMVKLIAKVEGKQITMTSSSIGEPSKNMADRDSP